MQTQLFLSSLFLVLALAATAPAQNVKQNIPYAEPVNERQTLDVYAPADGWQVDVSGRYYHDSGEIENSRFSSAARTAPSAFCHASSMPSTLA